MKKILILATAGAGGDLQPLMAVAFGLMQLGHPVVIFGDASVAASVRGRGIDVIVSPPEADLGPRLVRTIKENLNLEPAEQGKRLEDEMASWSSGLAPVVSKVIGEQKPDLLVTSLFGVGIARLAAAPTRLPWCVINSTFYVGPDPPRDLELDFSIRAVPLMRYFIPILEDAQLVLHATDRVFDFHHSGLPPRHHYTGPLIWEAPAPVPTYLDEPGDPWVLVTLSSQEQDDIPLGQIAADALAHLPVRILLTVGNAHGAAEIKHTPSNVRVEQYIPHSKVLERSRLLVSHAGHGSVMKAIWYGVPMVLVPWGRDQPGVAARAEHLGVARVVGRNQLTGNYLLALVQDALNNQGMRAASGEAAQRLHTSHPIATACQFLEQI